MLELCEAFDLEKMKEYTLEGRMECMLVQKMVFLWDIRLAH